jgi:non-specific serine/threonine protein kinase
MPDPFVGPDPPMPSITISTVIVPGDRYAERASDWPHMARHQALPTKLTSFVGRQHELAELAKRLDTTRLLTLVGPGGIGKTRLAIQTVANVADRFADGVFVVDVAPLTHPELLVQALAEALRLRTELDRQPQTAVLTLLAERQLVVLFDNCEHLVRASAELVEAVLQNCPEVRVVATSREPLGVEGEVLWRLAPLSEADAVQLFVDRARAQHTHIDSDDPAIPQVCRALDHLPLAIELAAARTTLLRPDEILPRLEDRFALLSRIDVHAGSARQRTLRATIDWSYELLEPVEQQLFRRLGVFAGTFDLPAALALGGPDALDAMNRLVDKSLVIADGSRRGTRYRLLDTLRQYAWERLSAADEVDLARQLHLAYFLGRIESLFRPTDSVDGPTRELDEHLDDLRGALDWCLAVDPQAGLRLVAATRDVWWRRSLAEGRRWTELFLQRCPETNLARARALQAAGMLSAMGEPQVARHLLLEAREFATEVDGATAGMVDYCLGFAAFNAEDGAVALEHLERALGILQKLGDHRGTAIVSVMLGWVLLTDATRREDGRGLLESAQQVALDLGDRHILATAAYGFGLYWRWTGQPRRALADFRRALEPLRALGEGTPGISGTLLHIARLLADTEPAKAARLAGAGLALDERMGVRVVPRLVRSIERMRGELDLRLGPSHARRAWTDGERLTTEEAIAYALEGTASEQTRPGGLSAREMELAQLVGRGLTSRQIADVLHLSPRTVDNHLARIYSKLSISSRLQLATWFANTTGGARIE